MTTITFDEHALRIEEVRTPAHFDRLRAPWNALVQRSGGSLFLRHEWFSAALAWCGHGGASPWIACAWIDDRLVGALPLLQPVLRPGGGRQLRFLVVPDSQWCDAVIDPDAAVAPAVAGRLADWLADTCADWDVLRLERLGAGSAVARWLLPALGERGFAVQHEVVDCNLFVDLGTPWPQYRDGLSRKLKKARNLACNRLERAGAVHLQWITADAGGAGASAPERPVWLDEAVAVSARSWKHDTGNALDRPGPQAFIRSLTAAALAEGWLSLWILRVGDEAIAMEYQLASDGCVHALRADFDERFAEMSPGTYLNFHLLEGLFGHGGHARYHMGPGNNPYKTRWSDTGVPVHTATTFAPTMRGRAGRLWSDWKPRLQTLRGRLAP